MHSDFCYLNPKRPYPFQYLGRKVQTRRRRRHRAARLSVNRLIAFPVRVAVIVPVNIGRKRYVSCPLNATKEIWDGSEADAPLAETATFNDLCFQFRSRVDRNAGRTKIKLLANPDLPQRFALRAPLNEPKVPEFYAGGAEGYADYPSLSHAGQSPDLNSSQARVNARVSSGA